MTPNSDLSRTASTNIPQITIDDASSFGGSISVPTIYVDSGDNVSVPVDSQPTSSGSQYSSYASGAMGGSSGYQSPIDSPTGVAFGFGGIDPFADDGLRLRGRKTPPHGGTAVSSPNLSPSASPLASPSTSPRLGPVDAGGFGGWFGNGTSRRVVADVPPQIMMGGLDDLDSEWRDQIRSFIESEMGGGGMSRSGSGASNKGG